MNSKVLEGLSHESSFSPTPKKRKSNFQEAKSDFIERSFNDRVLKKRRSQLSKKNSKKMNNIFIKKYDSRHSHNFPKQVECSSHSGASSKSLRQDRCLEHNKELDMVCEEAGCSMAVCSSCILFGSHKNHQYSQIEHFLENVSNVKENLKGVQCEVKRNKKSLILSYRSENLIAKIKNKRKSIERGLNNYCEKIIKRIQKKKDEMFSELKYCFKGLKSKLGKYCEDSVDLINANSDWEDTLSGLFLELESDSQSVSNSFRFLNKIKEKKLFLHGQKILDNFSEMQTHLNQKVSHCLESFSISYEDLGQHFFRMHRSEVDFSEDLKQKFQVVESLSPREGEKGHSVQMQNLKFHEMNVNSGPLDEECFLEDNLDPLSTNLMSSLNLLNEKVKNNEFDFSNQDKTSLKQDPKQVQPFDHRYPLRERPPNVNFRGSKTEVNSMFREQAFQKQNLLSSANMDSDIIKRHSRNKTSKSNKVFKAKSYHKKSQGSVITADILTLNQEPKPKARRRGSRMSNNIDILYTSNHNNMPFGLGNLDYDQMHKPQPDMSGIQSSRLLMNTKFNEQQGVATSRDNFFLGKSKINMYNGFHPGNMSMRQNHIIYDRTQKGLKHAKNNSHNISDLKGFDIYQTDKSEWQVTAVHKVRSPPRKKKMIRKSHKSKKKIHPKSFLVPVIKELRQNTLTKLNLAGQALLDKDVKSLIPSIVKATKLRKIILKENNLTDKSVDQICQAIRNLQVEVLDFSYNRISPACFTYIRKLHGFNTCLKHVYIKKNDIPTSIKAKKVAEFKKMGITLDPK